MLLVSEKFKYLLTARDLLEPGIVPDFKLLSQLPDQAPEEGPYIMRSALKDEAGEEKMLSGKSLSLHGLMTLTDIQNAWDKIQSQPQLQEIILQREIIWEKHATVLVEADFFLAEVKTTSGGRYSFYGNSLVKNVALEDKLLAEILKSLHPLLSESGLWLLELGWAQGRWFLFQIHPMLQSLVQAIFSSDLAYQLVSSRQRFGRTQDFLGLLKMEWNAYKFRSRFNSPVAFCASAVFMNWEFLFHYFRLFCMIHRLLPNGQSFSQFLSSRYDSAWPSPLIKKHLQLLRIFRDEEEFLPQQLGFKDQPIVYIGKGKLEGVVGEDILAVAEIPLAQIYETLPPRAILTKEVTLLSHPVLACAEVGIPLVLGMSELPANGAKIILDFDSKNFRLK
jgi:hypothetical protein